MNNLIYIYLGITEIIEIGLRIIYFTKYFLIVVYKNIYIIRHPNNPLYYYTSKLI